MRVVGDLRSLNRSMAAGMLPLPPPRPMTTPADGESLSRLFVRLEAKLPILVDGALNPNLAITATPVVVGTTLIPSLSILNVRSRLLFAPRVSLPPHLNLSQSTTDTVAAGTPLMWGCISPMQL